MVPGAASHSAHRRLILHQKLERHRAIYRQLYRQRNTADFVIYIPEPSYEAVLDDVTTPAFNWSVTQCGGEQAGHGTSFLQKLNSPTLCKLAETLGRRQR